MRKAYIYPNTVYFSKIIHNPYIDNFIASLEPDFHWINKTKPSNKGIFDIVLYLGKIKYIFLNWIEDLPDKRGGLLQTAFFFFLVYYCKLARIKIIWTMHNKESHYSSNAWLKKKLFIFILRKSDFTITHAKEGLKCFDKYNRKNNNKIRYFPHPLQMKFLTPAFNRDIDILIWGSIIPYKGIDKFLRYLHDKKLQSKYTIQLAGKVKPDDYLQVIRSYCNDKIRLDDRFVPENELKVIVSRSKVILFTYAEESILSSGALMDSLSFGQNILAPDIGAFKDAREEGLIKTFNSYEEMIEMIEGFSTSELNVNREFIGEFISLHDWKSFAGSLKDWIK